jgi:hypothetical protein
MNLRVDLILETEQRSASVVNAKGLIRIVSIVVPLIIVVIIGLVTSRMISLSNSLNALEAELKDKVPKKEAAIKYREEVGKNRQTLDELEGWRKSRVNWAEQLLNIQTLIPSEIQLTNLRINHAIDTTAGNMVRNFSFTMKGKALGEAARTNVEMLGEIEKNPALTNAMKEATVVNYSKNEDQGAPAGEMLFDVSGSYHPRTFK